MEKIYLIKFVNDTECYRIPIENLSYSALLRLIMTLTGRDFAIKRVSVKEGVNDA